MKKDKITSTREKQTTKQVEILIVEHLPAKAGQIKHMLEKHNFYISVASSGEEALASLRQRKPAVIISDTIMPKMDGYELCRRIKASVEMKNIPVILLTTLISPKDLMSVLECGADSFIPNPYNGDYLFHRIVYFLLNKKKHEIMQVNKGLKVTFTERKYLITSDRLQILNLLLSTYEIAVQKNQELVRMREDFRLLSSQLQEKVLERTATLSLEIEERKKTQETVKSRLELEKTISAISSRFVGVGGIDAAINVSLRDIGRFGNASRAYLFLFNQDTTVDNTREWCADEVSPQINNLKNIPYTTFPWWIAKLRKGEAIHIPDVSIMPKESKTEREMLENQGIKSLLVQPLHIKGRLAGFIGFDNVVSTGEWSDDKLTILRISGEIIGNALERRQAEEDLRKSEENFRHSLDESPLGIRIVSADWETLYANQVTLDIFGFKSLEEMKSTPIVKLYTPASYGQFERRRERRRRGKSITSYEIEIMRKDGQIRHVLAFPKKVMWDGELQFQVLYQDITERKQAQERIKQERNKAQRYLDTAGVTLVIVNKDQKISLINKRGCHVLGYKETEIIGKNWFDCALPQRDREKLRAIFVKVMEAEIEVNEYFECPVSTQRGEEKLLAWHNVVLHDQDGKPIGVLCSGEDITERKEAEKALEQTISELETFAYTAAHDLKAPLVTVQGFAAMLKKDLQNNNTARVEEDVRLIDAGISKMLRLLKTVLEYGRSNRMPQPTENVPFKEIVLESLEQLEEQVRLSGANVLVADNFPEVAADRVSMVQVLNNLIVNATQYRDKARPLTIDIGHRLSDGGVVYYVRDNGIGISPGEQEKVFDAFYRGSSDSEGTGLGLKIVKRIIEKHGGRVWIESEADEGTTVCFTIDTRKT